MSLFICKKCGCVENTALCNYWNRISNNKEPLCSECETGEWHDCFPKRKPTKEELKSLRMIK
jgi:hypothetical protein